MIPFELPGSPALAEVWTTGRASLLGVTGTLVMLASRGGVEIEERATRDFVFRIRTPDQPVALAPEERFVYDLLVEWSLNGRATPAFPWEAWLACLEPQLGHEGRGKAGRHGLLRRGWLPFGRSVHADPTGSWKRLASALRRYPAVGGPLPEVRRDWDRALAYAAALGAARPFLKNVREVCEYYDRHSQGVVMTFYTPQWFRYRREPGEDRFAFLTQRLSDLIGRFRWSRLRPESAPL